MSSPLTVFSFLSSPDDLMHVLIVILSVLVLSISVFAFRIRRNTRYLLLSIAFFFLAISQIVNFLEIFSASDSLFVIPYVGIHVAHLFDFLTLLTFGLALVRNWDSIGKEILKLEE